MAEGSGGRRERPEMITVGELRAQIAFLDDETPIYFGCPELKFLQIGGTTARPYVEFHQQVYFSESAGEIVVRGRKPQQE